MDIRTSNRRLLKLAAFLEKLPRKRFKYTTWTGLWGGAQDLSCGTTACALGWACTIPSFRRLGLHLRSYAVANGQVGIPSCNGWTDGAAAEEVFGPGTQALFYPALDHSEDNATPKQVAAKIRRFVKERSK